MHFGVKTLWIESRLGHLLAEGTPGSADRSLAAHNDSGFVLSAEGITVLAQGKPSPNGGRWTTQKSPLLPAPPQACRRLSLSVSRHGAVCWLRDPPGSTTPNPFSATCFWNPQRALLCSLDLPPPDPSLTSAPGAPALPRSCLQAVVLGRVLTKLWGRDGHTHSEAPAWTTSHH